MSRKLRRVAAWLLVLAPCTLASKQVLDSLPTCRDEQSCQARLEGITTRLDDIKYEMSRKQQTLKALEDLRTGILSGKRFEMPTAQRQLLEKSSPLFSEISFDARHRPVSTNVSRHFESLGVVAKDVQVLFHDFLPLRRSGPHQQALLILVDKKLKLHVYTTEGEMLLEAHDLGHEPGRKLVKMVLSPSQEQHFVLTADEQGDVRMNHLRVVAHRKEGDGNEKREQLPTQLSVTANLASSFSVPARGDEGRKLTALATTDKYDKLLILTGDSAGSLSVFHKNGTLKGRLRVTDDHGGVRGLLRSQASSLIFWSSHSFGYFSPLFMEVQYPPCNGWNSPLLDLIPDPSHPNARVLLALADGDVVAFAVTRGKTRACDLALKFPHVSPLPMKLHNARGLALGVPVLTPEGPQYQTPPHRELFFFSIVAMEHGYTAGPSKAVLLQASFKPKEPEELAQFVEPGGERGRIKMAIRWAGTSGVELFHLNLKQAAAPPSSSSSEGTFEAGSWVMDAVGWLPKFGVFGFALIGVVLWNVRKAAGQRQDGGRSGLSDFDEDMLQETLRERRMMAERQRGGAGARPSGGLRHVAEEDDGIEED